MEGNWGILVLLVVAVVIYALVRAYGQRDEDGDADAPESAVDRPDGEPGTTGKEVSEPDGAAGGDAETEEADMPWAECQLQLSEAPPIAECDRAEFSSPDEAETGTGPEAEIETEAEVEPVPESGHAINTAIRRKAWQSFRENYRRILPLSGAVVLLLALKALIPADTLWAEWLIRGWSDLGLFAVLIAPVVTLGATYAAVRLWKGEAPRLGMLAYFLGKRRILPALGLMLAKALIMAMPVAAMAGGMLLIQAIIGRLASDDGYLAMKLLYSMVNFLLILYFTALTWLTACMILAGFALSRAPERGAVAAFKAGFRVSVRHFGKVMGMLIAAGWPFGVAIVAQSIGATWSVFLNTPWVYQAFVILSLLLMLLYGGYFLLSMAGLAERLLPEGSGAPRTEAENPGGDGQRMDDLPEGRDPAAGDGNAKAPPAGNAPEDGTG